MAHLTSRSVVRQIESLFDSGSVTGLSDRQLLERFNSRRDPIGEAAFAALVSRHGPMVLDVCGQILGDLHHAEDAFQAVFMVLARRAQSIRDPDLLANWLYGVTIRTARCAKIGIDRRRKKEADAMRLPRAGLAPMVKPMVGPAEPPVIDHEQAEALHDEIDRLPNSFRLPVVLCYFEGLTIDEAARRLRWPVGTVGSRLARARDKLRRGLTRRGIFLPATALVAGLAPKSAPAFASSHLCDITTKAAINFASGQAAVAAVSPSATALAQGVLKSMFVLKLRFLAITLLFFSAIATGAGWVALAPVRQAGKPDLRERQAGNSDVHPIAAKPDGLNQKPAPGRMFVAGRVLDPSGKPSVGVAVDIIGRSRAPELGANAQLAPYEVLAHGATDGNGRFHLDAPRTASSRFYDLIAIAAAPGFGVGWTELNADAGQPERDVRLRPEQVVRARLVDVSGTPAAGVETRVQSMGRRNADGTSEGISHWANGDPPDALRAWPGPFKTDEQGRIVLSGIGGEISIVLTVRDRRFARQDLHLEAERGAAPRGEETTFALQPATIIEGRALPADTGKPIANVAIIVESVGKHGGWLTSRFRADDRGWFEVNPFPADRFRVRASPPAGQPYLRSSMEFTWTKGAVKKTTEIKLPRGVVLHGKVTEEGSGGPVDGASVHFVQRKRGESVPDVVSEEDGSFQVAVPAGAGYILVLAPNLNYVPKEIGSGILSGSGQPGGRRTYAHAIIPYQVKSGDPPQNLSATLRPGKTVKGHVVGPAGQAVAQAAILTRLDIEATNLTWARQPSLHARDGRFELHGLDPQKATLVYFHDLDHQWGTAVELSGSQADTELTVRLQPCGQARVRFVAPGGKPLAKLGTLPYIELVMTPGPPHHVFSGREGSQLEADATYMVNVDPRHYPDATKAGEPRGPATDSEGRITLPDLIPGALYRISDPSTIMDEQKGVQVRRDFTVKPSETLDLGDIVIEKPKA